MSEAFQRMAFMERTSCAGPICLVARRGESKAETGAKNAKVTLLACLHSVA